MIYVSNANQLWNECRVKDTSIYTIPSGSVARKCSKCVKIIFSVSVKFTNLFEFSWHQRLVKILNGDTIPFKKQTILPILRARFISKTGLSCDVGHRVIVLTRDSRCDVTARAWQPLNLNIRLAASTSIEIFKATNVNIFWGANITHKESSHTIGFGLIQKVFSCRIESYISFVKSASPYLWYSIF